MQRFLDILFSGVALLVLAPLLVPIMVILRFTGEGEVFYIQQRVGKDGEMFGLLKYATMLKDSPSLGTGTITVKDDPRVLPIGKFLRKTKINELPQLLNIIKGDIQNLSIHYKRTTTTRVKTHSLYYSIPHQYLRHIRMCCTDRFSDTSIYHKNDQFTGYC